MMLVMLLVLCLAVFLEAEFILVVQALARLARSKQWVSHGQMLHQK
jgi:hypothetical protein